MWNITKFLNALEKHLVFVCILHTIKPLIWQDSLLRFLITPRYEGREKKH